MLILALALTAAPAPAQSLLDRSPNVSGPWAAPAGVIDVAFSHRFSRSPAPEHKITGYPTFAVGAGLPGSVTVGFSYSTNSTLVDRYPNEWEFTGRAMPLRQASGSPVDVGLAASYNLAARGPAAELSLAREAGRLRLLAVGRLLSVPDASGTDVAVGGGAVLRLTRYVALAGDVVTLTRRDPGGKAAWSAGLQLALPNTPHTLSLHVSNTPGTTMQTGSRGTGSVRFGFEFTIPVTLSRYFGSRRGSAVVAAPGDSLVQVHIANLKFGPAQLEVRAGTEVEWINDDPLDHTVTATDSSFMSGPIKPGQRWRHRFTTPGVVEYHCTPHPFMHGEIRVRAAP